MNSVFSYIVTSDSGFAPNPFHGFCTLACCKPMIRRTARVGDWIVGLAPKRFGHGMVFAMRVGEKMTFADYWQDVRFQGKKPLFGPGTDRMRHRGDNAYEPLSDGGFRQWHCGHSNKDGSESEHGKHRDLTGRYVLVSDAFSFFGAEAVPLPSEFEWLVVGRGHRRIHVAADPRAGALVAFLENLRGGLQKHPRRWPSEDDSWKAHTRFMA